MHHVRFVTMADPEDRTPLVLIWEGCKPEEFAARLKEAVQEWAKTKEGSKSIQSVSEHAFNLYELDEYVPTENQAPELNRLLWQRNIRYLRMVSQEEINFIPGLDIDDDLSEV